MGLPQFENTKSFVFKQLEELSKDLYYHGRHHTFDDVLPQCIEICKLENLTKEETLLVTTAALFHDTGYINFLF